MVWNIQNRYEVVDQHYELDALVGEGESHSGEGGDSEGIKVDLEGDALPA